MDGEEMIKRGIYGIYKSKEYRLSFDYKKLLSKNQKLLENGFNYYINNDGSYDKEYLEKEVNIEELTDLYEVKYNIMINGKEISPVGSLREKITLWVTPVGEMKENKIYTIINLEELKIEHSMPVQVNKGELYVEVEMNQIEKFLEYKKHIGPFEYKGIERKELPNTEEIVNYLFELFPN